ncbi:hypothetical protein [Shewanella surugensis]|uniref:Large polyvalent protein associated domain-containing protein n=1 Tax=Shewanella surugensis TaxID=212020 RepID=A0ABT0L805_9GAMM|nr:hypothetical protein [Shewanella surugensis]MCL1123826.1 hypothetical protein [Shewanella surugensis]
MEQIKASPTLTLNNKIYKVTLSDDDEINIHRANNSVSDHLKRPITAIQDFFNRSMTKGESATQTRGQQLTQLVDTQCRKKILDIMFKPGVKHYQGANRDVYITPSGDGVKVIKSAIAAEPLKQSKTCLRLNEIYTSPHFYQGKYAHLARHAVERMIGIEGKVITVSTFKTIPDAEQLKCVKENGGIYRYRDFEAIPESTLQELRNAGFNPWDVKPDNFVKIKNDNGGYDYVPIDAKYIGTVGLERSNSLRTKEVLQLQKNSQHQYAFSEAYVDKDR